MKNQKGITLVALILIMVVLLILAGISISLVLTDKKVKTETEMNDNSYTVDDDVLFDINGNPITSSEDEENEVDDNSV